MRRVAHSRDLRWRRLSRGMSMMLFMVVVVVAEVW
jgi:hypothetical protein